MKMKDIQQRAEEANEQGKVAKTSMASKEAVLQAIREDRADAMSLDPGIVLFGELRVGVVHYAVRFNDRELGAAVRRLTMAGFGMRPG